VKSNVSFTVECLASLSIIFTNRSILELSDSEQPNLISTFDKTLAIPLVDLTIQSSSESNHMSPSVKALLYVSNILAITSRHLGFSAQESFIAEIFKSFTSPAI
ncbi:hypothetical protein HK096_010005, partial [Nowakowskiella sp. JEL0078]